MDALVTVREVRSIVIANDGEGVWRGTGGTSKVHVFGAPNAQAIRDLVKRELGLHTIIVVINQIPSRN